MLCNQEKTLFHANSCRHPAVSTESALFYAVNPSTRMFEGFGRWCFTGYREGNLQLSVLSSYARIRIWKVSPFGYCPYGDDGTEMCSPGRVKYVDIPGSFLDDGDLEDFNLDKCTMQYTVEVTSLEYLNAENIAVTVLYSTMQDYDIRTATVKENPSSGTEFRILYLSTFTMALSQTPWNREAATIGPTEGQLCPAYQRFPKVGSIIAESSVAAVHLARVLVSTCVSLPGLIEIWKSPSQTCPLATRGHSLLRKCGADLLSLDDFFDALYRSNTYFWSSLSLLSKILRNTVGDENTANIVDGAAYYGQATYQDFLAVRSFDDLPKAFVTAWNFPTEGNIKTVAMKLLPVDLSKSTLSRPITIPINAVRMAHYSYNVVVRTIMDMIPLFVRSGRLSSESDAAGRRCARM